MELTNREFWLTSYLLLGVLSVFVGIALQKRKVSLYKNLYKKKRLILIRRGWAHGRSVGWSSSIRCRAEERQGESVHELSGV